MNLILEELAHGAVDHVEPPFGWRWRWPAGVCLLGWLAVATIPNAYESQARLYVQLDDALANQIGLGADSRRLSIERVRQTLTSAVNLEKVVRTTRIGQTVTSPAQMERTVQSLAKDIVIVADEKNLFQIIATSGRSDLSDAENAELAQDVAQRMIDIVREENLGGSRGEMRETIDFLDQQLAERQKALEEAEQRRLAFEAEHPELAGGAQAISTQLSATRAELRGIEADLAAAQARWLHSTGSSRARRARSPLPDRAAPGRRWRRPRRTSPRSKRAG